MSKNELIEQYESIYPILEKLIVDLDCGINEFINITKLNNIDTVAARVKSKISYIDKALKKENEEPKYINPIKEIQDILGIRIVGYYKKNIEEISKQVKLAFREVEERYVVTDSVRKFGYEGKHFILFIPPDIINKYRGNPLIPTFFELQVLTLFQHAWAIGEHGIGYKPGMQVSDLTNRKLSFLSAQAWGADQILEELYVKKLNGEEI